MKTFGNIVNISERGQEMNRFVEDIAAVLEESTASSQQTWLDNLTYKCVV